MSGKDLKSAISQLGVSVARFSRVADLSIPTLTKFFDGQPVAEDTRAKALNAYAALKEKQAKELAERLGAAVG